MVIVKAIKSDLPDILALQKKAYISEAELVGDYEIQPLTQTLGELEQEYYEGTILIAALDGKLVGSIRAHSKNGTVYIGKLMVDEEYRRRGIATALLKAIENIYPDYRYELFTSILSKDNIKLYEKNGYQIFDTRPHYNDCEFVFLQK